MKRALLSAVFAALLSASCFASLQASASLAWVQNGSSYTYTITLKNTGTTTIGDFFYAWIPGQDYLPVAPSSTGSPNSWAPSIEHAGAGDGWGINWSAGSSSSYLAAGSSLTGFSFTTTATPTQILGNSPFYSGVPVGTSFVYSQGLFSDPGFKFVVTGPPSLTVSTLQLTASAIVGGNGLSGTVTLSQSAASGATVNLSSDSSAILVPATKPVAAGSNSCTFSISTLGVLSALTGHIKATLSSDTTGKSSALIVNPAALSLVSVSPSSFFSGLNGTGMVTLNGKAPSATEAITLTSNNANVIVPSSLNATQQSAITKFVVQTKRIFADATVTIGATYRGITKSGAFTLKSVAHASGNVSFAKLTNNYAYNIHLTNIGTKSISTLLFGWTPGKDLLPSLPTITHLPTGWSAHVVGGTTGQGYAILFTTTSAPLAAGASINGFVFTATFTPTQLDSASPFDSSALAGTSNVYIGAYASDPGSPFVLKA